MGETRGRSRLAWGLEFLFVLCLLVGRTPAEAGVSALDSSGVSRSLKSASAAIPSCAKSLLAVAHRNLLWTRVPAEATFGLLRTAFFPAVAVWDGVSALANKVRGKGAPASHAAGWLKKRWKNAVGYGLMLAALSTRTLTYDDVDRYVDKIQSAPVHRVILVDGFKSDRALSQVLQYRLKTRYAGTREVYVVSAADRATMLHALRQLTDDVGAADRLEFHGHGIPGQMDINGEAISKGSFRVSRIEMDEHGLDAEEFPMQTDESGFEMPGDAEMRGIVKDGGVIAAYSCDAAAGEEGQELLEYLHDTFPESSRVVGLTKVLNPLFLENAYVATLWTEGKEPPAWLADVAWAVDPLLAGPRLFSFVARSQPFQKDPAPIGTPAISGFAVFEARE